MVFDRPNQAGKIKYFHLKKNIFKNVHTDNCSIFGYILIYPNNRSEDYTRFVNITMNNKE